MSTLVLLPDQDLLLVLSEEGELALVSAARSFCNKSVDQVCKLVTGPKSNICNECIDVCVDIISDERTGDGSQADPGTPSSNSGAILAARCSLCRMPMAVGELVSVSDRGAVCVPLHICHPGDPPARRQLRKYYQVSGCDSVGRTTGQRNA